MYSHIIRSSSAMEIKFCITLLNVRNTEDNTKIYIMIISLLFFFSYFHFPSLKDNQMYLKSQYRQDLLLGVIAVDIQYTHINGHSFESVCLCIYLWISFYLFLSLYIYTHVQVYICSAFIADEGFTGIYMIWDERRGLLKSVKLYRTQLLGISYVCTHAV